MRALLVALPLLAAVAAAGLSCTDSVQADRGTDAYMMVSGAQFVRGPMPEGSAAGPAVQQITLVTNNIWPGMLDDPIGGALDPTATAAAVGLQGDLGYWIVPAGVPSVSAPNDPTFTAHALFSQGIVPGGYTLVVRAVDDAGSFGPPSTQTLVAETSPTNAPPTGDLVVTLGWDTEANLDLHVVDPTGAEIWWGDQSSQPPPPATPVDGGSYGYVDDDSNANCVIDGLLREDAIWPQPPLSGPYTVRVDTASLCGQPDAHWTVRVVLEGSVIAEASGISLDTDTWGNHGLGAGRLALTFTVP